MTTPSANRQPPAPRRINPWLNPHVLTIAWRDFARLFFSPIAIVVTLVFVLQNGVRFWMLMELFSQGFPITTEPFWMLFNSIAGLLLLFIIPPLTMKTFAEEKRLGTMETLMTAPVTEPAVVLGKFLSVFAFYVFLWLTTIPYLFILKNYTAFDWGPVVTLYGGMLMLGATFIAMGILASSLTRDQIIALVVTVIAVSLWLTVPQVLTSYEKFAASPVVRQIGQYMSVNHLIGETALGLVSLKSVVFFVSVTVLLLFVTVKVIESRKWAASGAAAVHETTFQRFTKYLGMVAVVLVVVDLAWALLSTLAVEWSWEVFRDVALYGQPWLPITAGVLLVLCVVTNLRFFKSLVVAGRSLVFINVMVQVGALVAVLVFGNLLGLALERKWDFTQWSVFSISEQTRSRLRAIDLKSPLTITMIWVEDPRVDPDGLRYRMVERLIRGYHQEVADPYLSYRIIDPHKQPEAFERFLNRTGMTEKGVPAQSLVVSYAGRSRVLEITDLFEMARVDPRSGRLPQVKTFRGERALTGAVLALTTNRPLVCFAADGQSLVPRPGGFGERGVLTSLQQVLENENIQVRSIDLALQGVPDEAAAVVVFRPTQSLPPRAVENLRDYLAAPSEVARHRGALLVIDANITTSGLEEMLQESGLTLTGNLAMPAEVMGQVLVPNRDGVVLAVPPSGSSHPITEGSLADPQFKGRGLPVRMRYARAIGVRTAAPNGMSAQPVLFNLPNSSGWVVSTNPVKLAPKSMPVMATAERSTSSDDGSPATRRIALATDGDAFDSFLSAANNTTLVANTFQWVTGRDRLIAGIAPRQLSRIEMNLDEDERRILSLVVVIIMPSLVLVIGGLGWWIRRR